MIERRLLADREAAAEAIAATDHPVTHAFLFPIVRPAAPAAPPLEPAVLPALSTVDFGSPKHFALIEICRRSYKRRAMEADRADKQARLERAAARER